MYRYALLGLSVIALSLVGAFAAKPEFSFISHWRSWLMLTLLVLIFDGILTALPIVLYNRVHILGITIGTIPIEDFSYLVAGMVLAPSLLSRFSRGKRL